MGVSASLALADSPSTLIVGNDPQSCPQAQYPTIQSAVTAAPPYATIKVCPGTYVEHVVVPKPVTLLGAQSGSSESTDGRQDGQKASVVVNAGQGAFEVTANDVKISGFTVQGTPPAPANSYPDAGIYLHTGSNRQIIDDVITGNGLGVYVENAQDGLTVTRDAFLNNTRGTNPAFIPAGGLFAAGGGVITNSMISGNLFTGNDQFSVNVGTFSQGLQIDHNTAFSESTLVVLGNAANPEVSFNYGSRLHGSAIYMFGNTQGAKIEHNQLSGRGPNDVNGGSGIRTTINFGAPASNTNATIAHNDVENFTFDGMGLQSLDSSTVTDNQVSSNAQQGLHLRDGATNNQLTDNSVTQNGMDGLRADSAASGNTIQHNRASGNGAYDCSDYSTGGGTAGTANFWLKDSGQTENRPGLCARPKGD
jgi:parallel beta-helix repeat protein